MPRTGRRYWSDQFSKLKDFTLAYGPTYGLVISIVEFVLLLGSKDGMRLGDEIAKTAVIETL